MVARVREVRSSSSIARVAAHRKAPPPGPLPEEGDDRSSPPVGRSSQTRAPLSPSRSSTDPGAFEILYGVNPVREALIAGRRKFRRLYVSRARNRRSRKSSRHSRKRRASSPPGRPARARCARLDGGADEAGAQGVAMRHAVPLFLSRRDRRNERRAAPHLLALDESGSRNLGAMARNRRSRRFRGPAPAEHRAAAVTPVAAKASRVVEHLRIARETNLADSSSV